MNGDKDELHRRAMALKKALESEPGVEVMVEEGKIIFDVNSLLSVLEQHDSDLTGGFSEGDIGQPSVGNVGDKEVE